MLYSVILGDQSKITHEWGFTTDSYNNTYIACDDLRQRLRLGPNVSETLDFDYSFNNTIGYRIAENIFVSNNNKNMNLDVMNIRKKKGDTITIKNPDILYLSLFTDNYTLLSYQLNKECEILHTYRWRDSHQGCVIIFDPSLPERELSQLIRLSVKDKVTNRFAWIDVKRYIDKGGNPRIQVHKTTIEDGHVIFKLKKQAPTHFKIHTKDNRFLTCAYIVKESEYDVMDELTNTIANRCIFKVPDDFNSSDEKDLAILVKFSSAIAENRIRAITVTNSMHIPNEFLKDNKILYMFSYNMQKNTMKCIKSN